METIRRLSLAFFDAHPHDAARVLESQPPADVARTLAACPPTSAATVMTRMVPPRAAECLAAMPEGEAAAIADEMSLEAAAPVLRRLAPENLEGVLGLMKPDRAALLRNLVRYPEGSAGALMDPTAFTLPEDITVAEARTRVTEAGRRVQYYLYVVDRDRRLVGVLNLRDFMLADPEMTLARVMRREVVRLPATAIAAEILQEPTWRRYLSLPVVDKKGVFLGVLELQALRRAAGENVDGDRTAMNTLMAIGELYWTGLADVVTGLAGGSSPAPDPNEEQRGGHDAR